MRYDKTERLGVIETDRIITKEIGWIFREQPIVDVGLDAIIEQAEDGNPTGKFLAVQIKTGKGNFQVSEKKITYYVSNIHYNYWLNLEIPIILIAHFPESEKTYWQQINEHNLKKTKKHWKLEFPIFQELNKKSKNKLTDILSDKSQKSFVFELYKGKVEPDSLFDIAEDVNCIADSKNNVNNFVELLLGLKEKTDLFNADLKKFSDRGLSYNDLEVKASIKGFARQINITSKSIENEIIIFSELYSVGFYAYEQVIHFHYLFTKDLKEFEEAKKSIIPIPSALDEALKGIAEMRNGVSKLPNQFSVLKEAKGYLLEVIDMIIIEYTEAKSMAEKIINNLEKDK
jgi:hypothetical protein